MDKSIIDNILEKAKSRSAMGQYDEKTVRALKKQPGVENPFALATAIKQGTVKHKSEESDMEKCHTHVLDGETEDGLKAKKKQAPKADGHVLGADPKDKRGSEYEMVEAWAPGVSKKSVVDDLLQKAVYGAGASGGKFQRGSGKDESKPSAVRKPELTEEQKKKYISGAQTKASHLASSTGMHGLAAKIKAEKSIDERTCDLVKALNVDYGPRKSGVRRGGWKQDPDAGIDKKKEEAMDSQPVFLEERNRALAGPQPAKSENKSLDERTCNLTKDMSQQREREIHDAVSTIRMTKENLPEAAKMDVKPEDVQRAHSLHTNLSTPRTQKSICDKWQDSPFISKGARVMPLGPGGDVQTLVKDDSEGQKRSVIGGRQPSPSYQETDKAQERVQTGATERERKAKMRIAAMGASIKSEEPEQIIKSKDDPTYHETDVAQERVQTGKAERERKAKKRIADLGAE